MITIRMVEASDFAAIQKLNHALFVSDAKHDPELDPEWAFSETGEKFYRKIAEGQDGTVGFVAEDDGTVIGYISGSLKKPEGMPYRKVVEAELDTILVSEAFRNQGIGERLVDELTKWCKQQGAQVMLVKAYTKNSGALGFYERKGFEPYVTELQRKL